MSRIALTLGLILVADIVSSGAFAATTCPTNRVFSTKQNKCVPPPPGTKSCPPGTKLYAFDGGGFGEVIHENCWTPAQYQAWLSGKR